MSSPSKVRGTRFESLVREYLRSRGFSGVDRSPLRGNRDEGDLIGLPLWVLELKATKIIDLAGAVDEARLEAKNAGKPHFAAVVKRRRKSVSEAYVVIPLGEFVGLLGSPNPARLTP